MQKTFERQLEQVVKSSADTRQHGRTVLIRCLLVAVAIAFVVLLGKMLEGNIGAIETWVHAQGAWMPLVFALVFLLATLICLPADFFVFIAGTLFGFWWGFALVIAVEWVAMIVQFYLARSLFKGRITAFLERHARFRAIDEAISRRGLRIAFLLRLGPIPFCPLSYALGISKIDFRTYMLAGFGILPSLLPIVYYGALAGHLARFAAGIENHGWVHYAAMIGSAIVFVVITVYIARVASKALKEANAL